MHNEAPHTFINNGKKHAFNFLSLSDFPPFIFIENMSLIKIRESNCVFNFPDYNRVSETVWLMVVKSVFNGSPLLWAYGTQHHHGGNI